MLLDRVETLLARERAALLSGSLGALEPIAAEKARLIAALATRPGRDPARLARLARQAAQNQALLEAALGGLRRVAARIAAHADAPRGLDTYDAGGTRHSLPAGPPRHEHRA